MNRYITPFYLGILCFSASVLHAQNYTISTFDYTWCGGSFPTAYVTGDFSITETSITGVSGLTKNQSSKTIIIDLPANFEFKTAGTSASVTVSGTELTVNSWTFTSATRVTVTLSAVNSQAEYNTLYFNDFEIRATSAGSGIIYRNGGTFKIDNSTSNPASSESWGTLVAAAPFSYTSSEVDQPVVTDIPQYSVNKEILRIKITGTGTCGGSVTSFSLSTSGTNGTDLPTTNITTAKIYYTGSSSTFATTTFYGSTASPDGAFEITGSQQLADGDNYFWLTYDVPGDANTDGVTPLNRVDAQLYNFVLEGSTKTDMSTPNPAGYRSIIGASYYYSRATGNWNDNTNWSATSGGGSCSCQPNGSGVVVIDVNHNVTLDVNRTADAVEVHQGAILTGGANKTLTVNAVLKTLSTGYFSLAGTLTVPGNVQLSGSGSSSNSKIIDIGGDLDVGSGTTLTASGAGGGDGEAIYIGGNLTLDGALQQTGGRDIIMDGGVFFISGSGSISNGRTFIIRNGNKSMTSGSNLSITPAFTISGAYTVTNNATVSIIGSLDGDNASSKWVNASGSYLNYGGSAVPFATNGILEANASNNTINYNRANTQTIARPNNSGTYYNLVISNSNTKSLSGSLIISNDLTISGSAQLDVTATNYSIEIRNDWTNNSSNGTPFNARSGTVTFNGSAAQDINGSYSTTFYNLTLDNSSNINLAVGNTVNSTLTLTNGKIVLGNYNLTIGNSGSISGNSSSRYIVTDGTGYLRQQNIGTAGRTGDIVFPVGANTSSYNPATLNNTGTADRFDVKVCNYISDNGNCSGGSAYGSSVINRTWDIEEATPGGSNVSLILQWEAADELASFDRANCYISHHDGSKWAWTQATGAASGSGPYTRTSTGLSSFSPHGVGSMGVLPIELLAFTASYKSNVVELQWHTASEKNNEYFVIERTADGIHFTAVARVKGAGNSNEKLSYSVRDENPLQGVSFYRLKQVDFDGKYTYSQLAPVSVTSLSSGIKIIPNPSMQGQNPLLVLPSSNVEKEILVVLLDIHGKELYSKIVITDRSSERTIAIDPSHSLAPGVYFITASSDSSVYRQKLVVR